MTDTDELAGLPEDVREAVEKNDLAAPYTHLHEWPTIRAELLRQAREIADLRVSIVGLGAMRKDIEAELEALKRRIAEAPTALVRKWSTLDREVVSLDMGAVPYELIGQRVALLPVGGE